MSPAATPDFEKLGYFYLGRQYDVDAQKATGKLLMYDSKDLTTHAVCVGMTGSGKTGLCLALLEEAAIDGIPAIAIDPKGDLGNLLLTFPELRGEDFRPWVDADEAARSGLSVEQFADETARQWRDGLARMGTGRGADRDAFATRSTWRIYTPGSSAGTAAVGAASRCRRRPVQASDAEALRRTDRGGRVGAVGPAGDRRRSAAQPRAHPVVEHPGSRVASRPGTSISPA